MADHKVELLPTAYDDLGSIVEYLLVDKPSVAVRVVDEIMFSLQQLEQFPLSGTPLMDRSLKEYDFRMVIADPYVAFYRFIDDRVLVYCVLHGASDIRHLFRSTL